ncbi:MAG: peptidase S8 [Myxococcales bacterium]|nr:peptidase S8 [Myxococcales bacterium]
MSKPFLSLALAVAAGLVPTVASADPNDAYGPPPEGVAPNGASWDVPGTIIVDGDDSLSDSELADVLASVAAKFPGVTFEKTDFDEDTKIKLARVAPSRVAEIVDAIDDDARLENVEPLAWVRAEMVPNDPMYKDQWHMKRAGAEAAWDYGTGRGVTVAVIDTGIACEDHEGFMKGTDLASTDCVPGWNLIWDNEHANDDHGHGTHVAGTIAQSTNNGVGVTGLAFDARLMPVKVLDKRGWGTTLDVANGIRWAADNGAQVINLSLGGPQNSKVLQDAVAHAREKGVVIVASAGNSGGSVGYPGGSEGVIGVSASDQNDKLASFSSRGPGVDIAAPGVDVVQQTICQEGKNKCEIYASWKGTSMASPHVAAAAALLVGAGVTDPEAVEARLEENARVVDPSQNGKRLFGSGILDAGAALRKVAFDYGLARLGFLVLLTGLVTAWARKGAGSKAAGPKGLGYWVAALATGPGLLFFAPLVLSRSLLPIDILARPIADLDLFIGAGLHRLLPLATALVPFGLLLVGFQSKVLRQVAAGAGVGTAAYIASLLVFREAWAPFGGALLVAWLAANALASLVIARTCLSETK